MRIVEATEIVMDLASQQWGLFTTAQATAEGVSAVMLGRLVDRAVLTRVRSGVYVMESTPWSPEVEIRGQWLALDPPVLAADRLEDPTPVVVSHESAAMVHKIGDLDSHGVHFTVPARRQTRQRHVVFHIGEVAASDWVVVDGLPVTTALRTVVDLARAGHEPGHLVDMLASILDQHLATREESASALVEVAERFGISRPDRAGVQAWLDEQFPVVRTSAEEMMRRQLDTALAPLQEQMRVLMEQIAPTRDLYDALQAAWDTTGVQESMKRIAAQVSAEVDSSVPVHKLRGLLLPGTADSGETTDDHPADSGPSSPAPPGNRTGDDSDGNGDPELPGDTRDKEHG